MALYVKFDCATCENKNCTGHGLPTTEKVCDGYKHTTTNADRIRSMTDEELAEFLKEQTSLAHNYGYECADGEPDFPDGIPANYDYLTWLQQEVADGEQS